MEPLTIAFRQYLTHVKRRAPETIERYSEGVAALLVFLGVPDTADANVSAISSADVVRFLERDQANRPSPIRFNVYLSALRAFFGWPALESRIMKDPTRHIDPVKVPVHPKVVLDLTEMLRLVAAVREHAHDLHRSRDLALVTVLFHCSLRVSELVSIRIGQVDLEHEVIHEVITKGDKRLSVVMNDVVMEALRSYLPDRANLSPAAGESALFLSQLGQRLAVRSVQRLVRRYAALAGVRATPHVLRHASATEMIEFTDIDTVRRHLGHESTATTQRYIHAKQSRERAAVHELGRRYRRAASGTITEVPRAA